LAPVLDLSKTEGLWWLNALVSLQMSDREIEIRKANLKDPTTVPEDQVFVSLKDTLHTLFVSFSGINGKQHRVFSITDPKNGGGFVIIFVLGLRLDLASFTLVADVAAVPLDNFIVSRVGSGIQALLQKRAIMQIIATPAEVKAWKRILPGFVERCRTWSHKPRCEYVLEGAIPRSTQIDESPICTCGRTIGLPTSLPGVPAEAWRSMRPYATRAAFSPIFAVSYVEPVAGEARKMFNAATPAPSRQMTSPVSKVEDAKSSVQRCLACGGAGKPKLLTCARCKTAKYCSTACSEENWKRHKAVCHPV
jgi:hypothetical protein